MSDPTVTADPKLDTERDNKIARLERRLARERQARRDAEEIADRGMRELWLTNQSLDARVEERTADLEATLEKLRVARTSRERFLGSLSHEMRTPLNGILGMLELLAPHITEEQARSYLGTARVSAERLHQLLARLLDMVDLDTGTLQVSLTTTTAKAIADSIRERWQLPAMRGGHLLTVALFGESQALELDEGRVCQIVDELLDNAVTHSDQGAVRVKLRVDDDVLTVAVHDAGPGIDPDRIEGLFSDFSMLDDTPARPKQGLGLGLGLSRRIAEALGGSLTLESDGQSYSLATLSVPARSTESK